MDKIISSEPITLAMIVKRASSCNDSLVMIYKKNIKSCSSQRGFMINFITWQPNITWWRAGPKYIWPEVSSSCTQMEHKEPSTVCLLRKLNLVGRAFTQACHRNTQIDVVIGRCQQNDLPQFLQPFPWTFTPL